MGRTLFEKIWEAHVVDEQPGEPALARAVEAAVDRALEQAPTPDVGGTATTSEFGDVVLASLEVAAR